MRPLLGASLGILLAFGFGGGTRLAGSADVAPRQHTLELTQVGQVGGLIGASHVDSELAYIGVGPRLVIVDMSQPTGPQEVGRSSGLRGLVNGIDVSNGFAYVTHGEHGLSVVDVADPRALRIVARLQFPGPAFAVCVVDDIAYVAAGNAGLRIVSVSEPSEPRELGILRCGLYIRELTVSDGHAYLAAWTDGLQIVAVDDPRQPREIGRLDTPGFAKAVAVVDDVVYLADGNKGLRVISVEDKKRPVEIGSYDDSCRSDNEPWEFYAGGVDTHGQFVYTGGEGRLWVLNVSDQSHPRLIGSNGVSTCLS